MKPKIRSTSGGQPATDSDRRRRGHVPIDLVVVGNGETKLHRRASPSHTSLASESSRPCGLCVPRLGPLKQACVYLLTDYILLMMISVLPSFLCSGCS